MSSLTLIPSSLSPRMVGRRSGYHDRDHVQAEGELCAMRVFNNWLRLKDGGEVEQSEHGAAQPNGRVRDYMEPGGGC